MFFLLPDININIAYRILIFVLVPQVVDVARHGPYGTILGVEDRDTASDRLAGATVRSKIISL